MPFRHGSERPENNNYGYEQSKEHIPVSIYLVNGIKLQGQIESFDQYVVLLRNTVTQMVYKHAISTVVPTRSVNVASNAANSSEN